MGVQIRCETRRCKCANRDAKSIEKRGAEGGEGRASSPQADEGLAERRKLSVWGPDS